MFYCNFFIIFQNKPNMKTFKFSQHPLFLTKDDWHVLPFLSKKIDIQLRLLNEIYAKETMLEFVRIQHFLR